jgi:hypothetical protein
MSNASNTQGRHERLVNSLKIATFLAVVGMISLSAKPPELAHSAPQSYSIDDSSYSTATSAAPAAAATEPAKAADYFPSQFQISGTVADPNVPTF